MDEKNQEQAANSKEIASRRKTTPPKRTKSRTKKTTAKTRATAIWSGLALVLSLIALGLTGYGGYFYYQKQEPFNANVLGTLKRLDDDAQQLTTQENQVAKQLQALEEQLSSIKQIQDTLGKSVDKVSNELGRNRTDWVLAEIEQLLLIANYRLRLAHDPDTAAEALRTADQRLQQLAEPRLLPVREQIAAEITQLQSLERADVSGIALKLGSLANSIDNLPLNVEDRFRPPPPSTQTSETTDTVSSVWTVLQQMWQDVLGLVRIRRITDVQRPLLAPEHDYFLRENLRLMLYGAQLALLEANVGTYTQNIKTAQGWINDNFDTDAQAVINAQQELSTLLEAKIAVELPDVAGSLETLRAITEGRAGS
ncbi:MAG: uroporphyrinogen-III C-methyltransferase [Acidiferrobacterales bacterium]